MVDIITNSSTELFVLDTEKSVDVVKDILTTAVELHNKSTGENNEFDHIFGEVYFGNVREALDGWTDYYKSEDKEAVIIKGYGDNSIPYWMFDFIENIFGYGTKRYHLG